MTDNVPPIQPISDDQMERIKAELGLMAEEVDASSPNLDAPTPIRRKRGRPRKYPRDEFNRPIKDRTLDSTEPAPEVLPAAPLTTRDGKEVATRIQNLLKGSTQIAATLNPHVLMTDSEAENIAKPLSSYLLRTEATSKVARRVLDEYDVAVFVIATMAYMVRVVKDVRSERESTVREITAVEGTSQRVPTSGRAIEPEAQQIIPSTTGEDENGQEGPISSERAATFAELRRSTEV